MTKTNVYVCFQEKQRFLTDVLHEVMLLDGLSSSHPISQEVEQATDIDRVFDWIAYKKVSSLQAHMLPTVACQGNYLSRQYFQEMFLTRGDLSDEFSGGSYSWRGLTLI